MTLKIYKNSGEDNRVNKTDYLTEYGTYQGNLREVCDFENPNITIDCGDDIDDLLLQNYVYIQEFNRYYFITDKKILTNKLLQFQMKEDYLMSFKTAILNLSGLIDRQENQSLWRSEIIDSQFPLSAQISESVLKSTVQPFSKNLSNPFNILVTCTRGN